MVGGKTAEGLEAGWTGANATCPEGVKPGEAGLNQTEHTVNVMAARSGIGKHPPEEADAHCMA